MRVAQTHASVDFEIERHALALADVLDRDVMDEQAPPAGDQLHALEHGLVVERQRIGGDGQRDIGPPARDRRGDFRLDRGDALQRQGARDEQPEFADDPRAVAAKPNEVGSRDAGHALHRDAQGAGEALGRGVDQRVDGAPSQAKAGDADEHGDADRGAARRRAASPRASPRGRRGRGPRK